MYICEIQYAPYADGNDKTFKIKLYWGGAEHLNPSFFLALLVIFHDYFGIVLLNYFTT